MDRWELILACTILFLTSIRTHSQIGDFVGLGASTVRGYINLGINAIIDVFQTSATDPAIRRVSIHILLAFPVVNASCCL